jgi:hypothetical protein
LQSEKIIVIIFSSFGCVYDTEWAWLAGMNRREFFKRTAAAAAFAVLDFSAVESAAVLRPTAGATSGAKAEQMVLGGKLFTAYARGGSSVNGPMQKLKLSQTRFLAGWKMANNQDFQQLL